MLTSFKDFFDNRYFSQDHKYVDIVMSKDVIQEMSVANDISKQPIRIDQDDIEFLKQFPSQYWSQALHHRYYHDLADALEERQHKRAPIHQNIEKLLKQALFTGKYKILQGKISDDLLNRIKERYGHVIGDKSLSEKAATFLSELEAEKNIPHSTWPAASDDLPNGFKKYRFKKNRSTDAVIEIVAKPYINRLIHKLERTEGHPHHPESGLPNMGHTHGQYGYDLHDFQRGDDDIPHAARGMQLPTAKEIITRMSDYYAHNAHGMYGDMNFQGENIIWKPMGEGRSTFKDNWTWKKVYKKLFPRVSAELTTAEPGTFELPDGTRVPPEGGLNASEKRAIAHKLTMERIFDMIENGELKGPPIPGIAPQGLPFKIKIINGRKMIDAPLLYLPHLKNHKIRVNTPNGVQEQSVDLPLVKPAEYLRLLGSHEEDEDGIDPAQLRGHQKDYIVVPPEDYYKAKDYVASGALHPMQNSAGRKFLDQSDPEYNERKQSIEEAMGFTGLDKDNRPDESGEGQYFSDIIKGIWNCIKSGCGGMTSHEISIMQQNVHDIHQMVYQKMMMNLRDEKMETEKGRVAFAMNVASSWAQQDLGEGGGTRRKRRLTKSARDESMDDTRDSNEGGKFSLRDSIQQRMVDRDAGNIKLKQGEKFRPAGYHQFGYNIDNLRQILKELQQSANKVDADRNQAIQLSHEEIGDNIAKLIGDSIADKAAFVFELEFQLKQLLMFHGLSQAEAEHIALQKVQQYGSNQASAAEMVKAFEADKEIQQKINNKPAGPQLSLAQQDAMKRLNDILQALQTQGKLNDPTSQQLVYNYIAEHLPDDVKAMAKIEADKRFGKVMPTSVAQKVPQKMTPKEEANALIAKQDWVNLSRHPYFVQFAAPTQMIKLADKIEAMAQTMPDGFERDGLEMIVHRLKNLAKNQRGLKIEMTGAIYNGEKRQQKDYQWWGAPETAGMNQSQAKKFMEKDLVKGKKK